MAGKKIVKEDKVRIKYIFSKDYNPVSANGAFGGVGTRGDIILNFFYERPPLPKETVQAVSSEGEMGRILTTDPEDFDNVVIRYVTNGVALCYDDAVSVRDFLSKIIDNADKIKEQKDG